MRRSMMCIEAVLLLAGGTTLFSACNQAKANVGPNGGDVVAVPNTGAKAEVIGNPDTGEVVVRTWNEKLDKAEALPEELLVLGEGERRLELMPHAMADDPAGRSSRFYGRAEWLRGGKVERGWLECCGGTHGRHEFTWSSGWEAGRRHGDMWREMGGHGAMPGQGMGHGMGHGMGMAPGTGPQGQPAMQHMPAGAMGVPPAEPSPSQPPPGNGGR